MRRLRVIHAAGVVLATAGGVVGGVELGLRGGEAGVHAWLLLLALSLSTLGFALAFSTADRLIGGGGA